MVLTKVFEMFFCKRLQIKKDVQRCTFSYDRCLIDVRLYNKVVRTCFVDIVCCIMMKTGTRIKRYKNQSILDVSKLKRYKKSTSQKSKKQKRRQISLSPKSLKFIVISTIRSNVSKVLLIPFHVELRREPFHELCHG